MCYNKGICVTTTKKKEDVMCYNKGICVTTTKKDVPDKRLSY